MGVAMSQKPMSERELMACVVDLARVMGWRVAHFRPALTSKGWRTPVGADGAGFPDLLMVRDRIVAAELKGDAGRLSNEQRDWLQDLRDAGAETYMWRPADWESGVILRALQRVEVTAPPSLPLLKRPMSTLRKAITP
jgi:hypothetical protein